MGSLRSAGISLPSLDERWVELGGAAWALRLFHGRSGRRGGGTAPATVTRSQLRSWLTDDLEFVDHRPLGFGRLSAGEWAEAFAVSPPSTFTISEVVRHDDRCVLVRNHIEYESGEELEPFFEMWERSGDGKLRQWELFQLSDRHAAIARFEELSS